jgi:hypothetical protein
MLPAETVAKQKKRNRMISRRKVLELGSAVIGGRVLVGSASAQDAWPSGDIKTICPFPAGTGADIVVRWRPHKCAGRLDTMSL